MPGSCEACPLMGLPGFFLNQSAPWFSFAISTISCHELLVASDAYCPCGFYLAPTCCILFDRCRFYLACALLIWQVQFFIWHRPLAFYLAGAVLLWQLPFLFGMADMKNVDAHYNCGSGSFIIPGPGGLKLGASPGTTRRHDTLRARAPATGKSRRSKTQ